MALRRGSMIASMLKRTLVAALTLAALAAAPASAGAADTVVVPDAAAHRMTAIDGLVVWMNGNYYTTLMQRNNGGTVSPVIGAPTAHYLSLDLGRNVHGNAVLTYIRCTGEDCKAYADDLNGHRTILKHLVPKRCELTAAPSIWRDRIAYGLDCSKLGGMPGVPDKQRSGLFVRTGTGAAKRLPLPADAKEYAIARLRFIDLRGTNVGAAAQAFNGEGDYYPNYVEYAQTVNGTHLRSRTFANGGDEGSPELVSIDGLSLGAGGRLWTLNGLVFGDGPYTAAIGRLDSSCTRSEALTNPALPGAVGSERAYSMTVDTNTIYLFVPGTGIVTHEFVPAPVCDS